MKSRVKEFEIWMNWVADAICYLLSQKQNGSSGVSLLYEVVYSIVCRHWFIILEEDFSLEFHFWNRFLQEVHIESNKNCNFLCKSIENFSNLTRFKMSKETRKDSTSSDSGISMNLSDNESENNNSTCKLESRNSSQQWTRAEVASLSYLQRFIIIRDHVYDVSSFMRTVCFCFPFKILRFCACI